MFATITAIVPPLLAYFYYDYLKEKRIKQIESALPSALFQIASFPPKTSMEKIISEIAKADYGELSKEFEKATRQINAGTTVPDAIDAIAKRSSSALVSRACSLISESYSTGADLSAPLKEIAEDIFELQAIEKESEAALSMQKYTLLAGGGLLVPFILGVILSTVGALHFDLEGITTATNSQRQALLDAAIFGAEIYLAIFACLASTFIALQENSKKKAVLYFGALLPLSFLVFFAAGGTAFF